MSKKHNPTNAKPGSTRKEMTADEKAWLENFNRADKLGDEKALAKIVPDSNIFTEVLGEVRKSRNAKRRDIYNNQIAIHPNPSATTSLGEAMDGLIEDKTTPNIQISDELVNPLYDLDRYTAEDYNPPSFPDEDAMNLAIDHDREQLEKSKVKSFKEFVERYNKGKKHDPAS